MGNEEEKKAKNEVDIQGINDKQKLTQKSKDFQRFREILIRYEYYTKLLKLNFRNNKILQILYKRESIFDNYYKQMFYILENINYVNYQECISLSERPSNSPNKTEDKNFDNTNSKKDLMKVKFDLPNNTTNMEKTNINNNPTLNSSKNLNKSKIKKKTSFDINLTEETGSGSGLFKYNFIRGEKKLYHELILIMEKICLYDIKKIQKILLLCPINNLRWIIWLSIARYKYSKTQNKIKISNTDIFNEIVKKIELKDDSLMFELHNTLKELKVFKCNWSICLYKIIKSLLQYKRDFKYETGMNILIGVPLLISDCNEEDTFFFARYLFSSYYGLGLCYFFGEDELLLNYLVFVVKQIIKEKFPKISHHLFELNIADELWIKKWIKTFFSSIFDLSITIRVWDCVIAVGLRFLVNYSVAIFEFFKDRILQLKKVKSFLEFFDYDLKKKYTKKEDVIKFRENIIKLAQSYYIPDGKFKLIEKEYLDTLFHERGSLKSEPFDTSKTINNYYSNNDTYDEEQYHIKLILRTVLYIPSEFLKNNVEDKDIYKFKKKKTNKWLEAQKSNKIDEMEKDSELSYFEGHKNNLPKKNKTDNLDNSNLYSSNSGSYSNNKNDEDSDKENNSSDKKDYCINDESNKDNNFSSIKNDDLISSNQNNEKRGNSSNSNNNKDEIIKSSKESKENKESNQSKGNKESKENNDSLSSKKKDSILVRSQENINTNNIGIIIKNIEENGGSQEISSDNEFNFSFHDEQLPDDAKD